MADTTPNTGLKKPLENESADISVVNQNMDKIDQVLGAMSSVPTMAKNAAGAIAELHTAIANSDIPDATLTTKGKVQLSSTTNSTAENLASTPKAVKAAMDTATGAGTAITAHAAATNVHGATSAATASQLIIRDSAGRAKVATPSAADDIARLDSITKTQAGLGSVDNYGTATQAEAEAGTATNKFMTPQRVKQYTDKRLLNNIIWRNNAGQPEWSIDGGVTWKGVGSELSKYKNSILTTGMVPYGSDFVNIVNIAGKRGYLSKANIANSLRGGNARMGLEIKLDGNTVYRLVNRNTSPSSSSFSSRVMGVGRDIQVGGTGSMRMPGIVQAFAPGTNLLQIGNYPYVQSSDVDINANGGAFSAIPENLFFEDSLSIGAFCGSYESGAIYSNNYEIFYATE